MKKFLVSVLLLVSGIPLLRAQQGIKLLTSADLDGVYFQLSREKVDTARLSLRVTLTKGSYHLGFADSLLLYAKNTLALEKKLNYKDGNIETYNSWVRAYLQKSENAKALQVAVENVKFSAQTNNTMAIVHALRNLSLTAGEKENNGITITIRDNGVRIPGKVKDKIYQPFFTTKLAGEGTGLGHSLSYDIITKEDGGRLHVETQEGQYAEFTIQIPMQKATRRREYVL